MSGLIVNIGSPTGKTLSPYIYGFCGGGLCWGFNENNDFDTVNDAGFQASAKLLQPQLIRLNCQQTTGMLQNIFSAGVGNPNWTWLDSWINNHSGFFNDSTGRLVFGIGPLSGDTSIDAGTYASWATTIAAHFKAAGQECMWWEIGNECTALGPGTYCSYFTTISNALLGFNSNYKCGGPVSDYWDDGGNGAAMLSGGVPSGNIGYIVWHAYGGGNATDLGTAISQGVNYSNISSIRGAVSGAGLGNIPLAVNEYNLSLNGGNSDFNAAMFSACFMTGCYQSDSNFGMGAIWDMVNSGGFAAIGNSDNGGNTSIITPQGYYLGYAGQHCGGTEYSVSGIPGSCIITATTYFNQWCVQIINYGGGDQTFNISFTGAPAPINPGATQWSMNSSGTPSIQTLSDPSSVSVPNQSISIVTGTFPGAGPPIPPPGTPTGTPTPTPGRGTPTPTPTTPGPPTPAPTPVPIPLTWVDLAPTPGNSVIITGLTPGTSYDIRVKASNEFGDTLSSVVSQKTTGGSPTPTPTTPTPPVPTPTPTPAPAILTTSATTAIGGTILTFTSTLGAVVGQTISGAGIAPGTTVSNVTATTITLSIPVIGNIPIGEVVTLQSVVVPTPTPFPTPTPTPLPTPTPIGTNSFNGALWYDDFMTLSLYNPYTSSGGTWCPVWIGDPNSGYIEDTAGICFQIDPFNPSTPIGSNPGAITNGTPTSLSDVLAVNTPSILTMGLFATPSDYSSVVPCSLVAAAINTADAGITFGAGYYEVKMALTMTAGMSFSSWAFGTGGVAYNEIDYAEFDWYPGNGAPDAAFGIWDSSQNCSSCNNTYGFSNDGTYHTYGIDLQASGATIYIDRQPAAGGSYPAPDSYNVPRALLLGMGVIGVTPPGLPQYIYIDYVAVWPDIATALLN